MSDEPELYLRGPGLKRQHRAPTRRTPSGPAPCDRVDCPCTHTDGCVRGWLDGTDEVPVIDEDGNRLPPIVREVTRPCPVCRPEAHRLLADRTLTRGQAMSKIRNRKER